MSILPTDIIEVTPQNFQYIFKEQMEYVVTKLESKRKPNNDVDTLIKNIPPISYDILLYMPVSTSEFTKFTVQSIFNIHNYRELFTGYDKNKCCVLEVYVPKGSHVLPNGLLKNIITPLNSKFKLLNKISKDIALVKLDNPITTSIKDNRIVKYIQQLNKHNKSDYIKCKPIPSEYTKVFINQINYMANLSFTEQDVIKQYTILAFKYVNDSLRGGNMITNTKIQQIINILDRLFKRVPPLQKNIIVYRGVMFEDNVPFDFTDKGYVSTSVNKKIASEMRDKAPCCTFKINIPSGSHVLPIMHCSEFNDEMEVLLSRNSEFKLKGNKSDVVELQYIEHLI